MSESSKKTLLIVDEQFEKIEGHYYEYNKATAEIFKSKGYDVVIFGHSNVLLSLQLELNAKPWFDIQYHSPIRKIPVLGNFIYRWRFWKYYSQRLNELLEKHSRAETVLFFPNVYWYNILPISWALRNRNIKAGLLYRTSIYDAIGLPAALKKMTLSIISSAVSKLNANKSIRYLTDSEVISKEWENHFNVPMGILPIPHIAVSKLKIDTPNKFVRLYLPGMMRLEKGAQILAEAMTILASEQKEILEKFELVTQFPERNDSLDIYKSKLEQLPINNVFYSSLSSEEYNRQLNMADVILIPYKMGEGYRARTSGILAEAIALSKHFITTDGTWMSLQASKYDCGMVIQDGNAQQLAQAITDSIKKLNTLEQKVDRARIKWLNDHSRDEFFSIFMSQ